MGRWTILWMGDETWGGIKVRRILVFPLYQSSCADPSTKCVSEKCCIAPTNKVLSPLQKPICSVKTHIEIQLQRIYRHTGGLRLVLIHKMITVEQMWWWSINEIILIDLPKK